MKLSLNSKKTFKLKKIIFNIFMLNNFQNFFKEIKNRKKHNFDLSENIFLTKLSFFIEKK